MTAYVIARSEEEIDKILKDAQKIDDQSPYELVYESGIVDGIKWLLGLTDEHPHIGV